MLSVHERLPNFCITGIMMTGLMFLFFVIAILVIALPSINLFAMIKLSPQRKSTLLYKISFFLTLTCQCITLFFPLLAVIIDTEYPRVGAVLSISMNCASFFAALVTVSINLGLLIIYREKPLIIAMLIHIVMCLIICLGMSYLFWLEYRM